MLFALLLRLLSLDGRLNPGVGRTYSHTWRMFFRRKSAPMAGDYLILVAELSWDTKGEICRRIVAALHALKGVHGFDLQQMIPLDVVGDPYAEHPDTDNTARGYLDRHGATAIVTGTVTNGKTHLRIFRGTANEHGSPRHAVEHDVEHLIVPEEGTFAGLGPALIAGILAGCRPMNELARRRLDETLVAACDEIEAILDRPASECSADVRTFLARAATCGKDAKTQLELPAT